MNGTAKQVGREIHHSITIYKNVEDSANFMEKVSEEADSKMFLKKYEQVDRGTKSTEKN